MALVLELVPERALVLEPAPDAERVLEPERVQAEVQALALVVLQVPTERELEALAWRVNLSTRARGLDPDWRAQDHAPAHHLLPERHGAALLLHMPLMWLKRI